VATAEGLAASFAELAVVLRGGGETSGAWDADPLRRRADIALETLAEVAGSEAKMAALKVHAAAYYAEAAQTLAGPAESPQEHRGQEMAVVAEVACVLTVSERTASALLAESHELTSNLPLTLAALQAGSMSWQHARVMVDETANLDRPAAAALEAHFLDRDAPNPARGCPAGELVASRFRHKARTWRERHHPVSIEKRHARGMADRRLEYRPDRDGMAWLPPYFSRRYCSGDLGTDHHRSPRPPRTRRAPAPQPTPRRRGGHLAPQQQHRRWWNRRHDGCDRWYGHRNE